MQESCWKSVVKVLTFSPWNKAPPTPFLQRVSLMMISTFRLLLSEHASGTFRRPLRQWEVATGASSRVGSYHWGRSPHGFLLHVQLGSVSERALRWLELQAGSRDLIRELLGITAGLSKGCNSCMLTGGEGTQHVAQSSPGEQAAIHKGQLCALAYFRENQQGDPGVLELRGLILRFLYVHSGSLQLEQFTEHLLLIVTWVFHSGFFTGPWNCPLAMLVVYI